MSNKNSFNLKLTNFYSKIKDTIDTQKKAIESNNLYDKIKDYSGAIEKKFDDLKEKEDEKYEVFVKKFSIEYYEDFVNEVNKAWDKAYNSIDKKYEELKKKKETAYKEYEEFKKEQGSISDPTGIINNKINELKKKYDEANENYEAFVNSDGETLYNTISAKDAENIVKNIKVTGFNNAYDKLKEDLKDVISNNNFTYDYLSKEIDSLNDKEANSLVSIKKDEKKDLTFKIYSDYNIFKIEFDKKTNKFIIKFNNEEQKKAKEREFKKNIFIYSKIYNLFDNYIDNYNYNAFTANSFLETIKRMITTIYENINSLKENFGKEDNIDTALNEYLEENFKSIVGNKVLESVKGYSDTQKKDFEEFILDALLDYDNLNTTAASFEEFEKLSGKNNIGEFNLDENDIRYKDFFNFYNSYEKGIEKFKKQDKTNTEFVYLDQYIFLNEFSKKAIEAKFKYNINDNLLNKYIFEIVKLMVKKDYSFALIPIEESNGKTVNDITSRFFKYIVKENKSLFVKEESKQ